MRTVFSKLVDGYPRSPEWRDPAFIGSPLVALLHTELPAAIIQAFPAAAHDDSGAPSAGARKPSQLRTLIGVAGRSRRVRNCKQLRTDSMDTTPSLDAALWDT
jgi:hypothetical protein